MKYKFVYRPFVKLDLQEATTYYKDISLNLAKDSLFRIREAKKYIALNVEGDDVMYKDVRLHNINQFPYHIHYFIDQENKQIVILSVAFSKRKNIDFSDRK